MDSVQLRGSQVSFLCRASSVVVALAGAAAAPAVAQSPPSDKLVADTALRIKALNDRFTQIVDVAQQKLDAANCRVDCPPEVGGRIGDEMTAAMDRITAEIHAQVDSFVQNMVDANGKAFGFTTASDPTTASAGCRRSHFCRGLHRAASLPLNCQLDGEAYGTAARRSAPIASSCSAAALIARVTIAATSRHRDRRSGRGGRRAQPEADRLLENEM